MIEHGRYHKALRVGLLVAAMVLVFDSGLLVSDTQKVSQHTYHYLGAVGAGMYAAVEENEINTLTAEIATQQRELDAREATLREREIAARSFGETEKEYSTYIISTLLFIIIVLLILNYFMDWQRMRQLKMYVQEST